MEIFMTILGVLAMIFCILVGIVVISFFLEVPACLRGILSALRERNEMEKEKLKIMKNTNNNKEDIL